MATIKVKFKESLVHNNKGTIYYLIVCDGNCRRITTQHKIYPHEWDNERSLIVINKAEYQRRYELQEIELLIMRDMGYLRKIIDPFKNADEIIRNFRIILNENHLSVYGNRIVQELENDGRQRTANSYKATIKSFLRFNNGLDISFNDIDKSVIRNYEKYLRDDKLCNNTISFYIRNLRALYNRATEDNYTEQIFPFKGVYVGNDKTAKRAIDIIVVSQLKKIDLSAKSWLDISRDMFLFCFYTRGMAYVDAAYLTHRNIIGEYIVYQRHKTGQELNIRLEPHIKSILKKYSSRVYKDYLLPILIDKDTSYDSALRLHNMRLNEISKIMNLTPHLTSYVARHSWATLAKKKGIPTQIISESMGHNNEKTTQIYLSSLDRSIIDEANAKLLSEI